MVKATLEVGAWFTLDARAGRVYKSRDLPYTFKTESTLAFGLWTVRLPKRITQLDVHMLSEASCFPTCSGVNFETKYDSYFHRVGSQS